MEAAEGRAEAAPATEAPQGTTEEAPEPVAGGQERAEAPSPEAGDEGAEAPFKLEDVPEEYRPYVEKMDRQWKAQFTRKAQEVSEEAETVRELRELQTRLESDDGAEALDELAEKYGFFRPEPEGETDGEDPYAELPEPVAQALRDRDAKIEELQGTTKVLGEAKTEADREGQMRVLRAHIGEALQPLKEREGGLTDEGEQLVVLGALGQPQANGLPNAKSAVALLEAVEAAAVARFVDSKKGPRPPDASGTDGVSRPDHSTDRSRRQHAEQVAARHYVSS